jgi:hypothetical protein
MTERLHSDLFLYTGRIDKTSWGEPLAIYNGPDDAAGWENGVLKCAHCKHLFCAVYKPNWIAVECPYCNQQSRVRRVN